MSVGFYSPGDLRPPSIAALDDAVFVWGITALETEGAGFESGPFGDTKLTGNHIARIRALPAETRVRKSLEFVNAYGE